MASAPTPVVIGVSLKMYFGHHRTLNWARRVAAVADSHPAVATGAARVFVLPSFPALVPVAGVLAGSGVEIGAQDVATADSGAYTGEVGAPYLSEIGCRYAEVGHAERRTLFAEDDTVVAAKTAAALRNGMTPVLCVGESETVPADTAARTVVAELDRVTEGLTGSLVVAYEPRWAIGAAASAPVDHITTVCRALTARLAREPRLAGSSVIYGGSAGPGLLTRLRPHVDGLFLGRFAHDPAALAAVLDEVHAPDAEAVR
ncbi:triose-phosphate isomerase family protein [Streptomyces spiramenti]|uniref:Triosephosphate isomerase n=1 Tax=Streptomyces spiramenti TaxID=2720606 RepID=A0ABX1AHM0_9ACTN|nr:triose-phosphate isomerase family protein [Streptomyces spiramenti]NJP66653.1 triosephosphate isomerase [Streptomyces spiramenti]